MGEAKRRRELGLLPTDKSSEPDDSSKVISWLPITEKQRDQFFSITKKGAWVGIACLVIFWILVRIIGPYLGWWIPADTH